MQLFADDQFIISDIEDNLQKAVYLLYSICEECNLEIATPKKKNTSSVYDCTVEDAKYICNSNKL